MKNQTSSIPELRRRLQYEYEYALCNADCGNAPDIMCSVTDIENIIWALEKLEGIARGIRQ